MANIQRQYGISRSGDFKRLFRLCNSEREAACLRSMCGIAHLRVADPGTQVRHVFASSPRVLDLACVHQSNTGCCRQVWSLHFGNGKTSEAVYGLRQGDQSNFGAVPVSEGSSFPLVQCGYGTSSKATAIPTDVELTIECDRLSIEETKKREFQRQGSDQRVLLARIGAWWGSIGFV